MALSCMLDVATEFNRDNGYVIDMNGWDSAVAHFVAPTGTINITASNDGNEIHGSTTSNSLSALNFITAQAVKLSDGTSVTTVAAAGLFRVSGQGRYVKFGGASAATTKLIIQLNKIS